jgi:hypothetical protein
LKGENDQYLENHPELRPLLDDFMGAIFRDKPSDIVKFGSLYFGTIRTQQPLGLSPLVISGPPQIGKTTFIRMLIERYPNLFGYAVVHTTRKLREDEVDGVDHHFVERSEFDQLESAGELVDIYVLHTNSYGVSRKAISKVSSAACLKSLCKGCSDRSERKGKYVSLMSPLKALTEFVPPTSSVNTYL